MRSSRMMFLRKCSGICWLAARSSAFTADAGSDTASSAKARTA